MDVYRSNVCSVCSRKLGKPKDIRHILLEGFCSDIHVLVNVFFESDKVAFEAYVVSVARQGLRVILWYC
jgi:hypothetical protein